MAKYTQALKKGARGAKEHVKQDVEDVKELTTREGRQKLKREMAETKALAKKDAKKKMPDIFSPEGFLILLWAFFLDIILGVPIFILEFFGIGIPMSWIVDVLGVLTIGIWSWRKTGHMQVTRRAMRLLKRPGLALLFEAIPIVGILPLWMLYVFIDLKKKT